MSIPATQPERKPVMLPAALVDSIAAIMEAAGMDMGNGIADVVEAYLEDAVMDASNSTATHAAGIIEGILDVFALPPFPGGKHARLSAMVRAAEGNPVPYGKGGVP